MDTPIWENMGKPWKSIENHQILWSQCILHWETTGCQPASVWFRLDLSHLPGLTCLNRGIFAALALCSTTFSFVTSVPGRVGKSVPATAMLPQKSYLHSINCDLSKGAKWSPATARTSEHTSQSSLHNFRASDKICTKGLRKTIMSIWLSPRGVPGIVQMDVEFGRSKN